MSKTTKRNWRHTSGGCHVEDNPLRPGYPCDDEYTKAKTGERFTVYTTRERHFDMPERVKDEAYLHTLDGVMEADHGRNDGP